MSHYNAKIAASLYAAMAIFFWGVSFVSAKIVLGKLDPFTLIVFRFGIGAVFLLAVILLTRERILFSLRYLPHLFILAILGTFCHQLLQTTSLIFIDASSAGWLISVTPVFTVLLSMIFLHEKLSISKALGIIAAIMGVIMVTTAGNDDGWNFTFNIGFFLMLLSTLNWAVYTVLLKSLKIPLEPTALTFYISFIGFLVSLPFIIRNHGWEGIPGLTAVEWGHLLFLGIFVSGTGYWFWAKSLKVLQASQAGVLLYLEPIVTFAAAIIILHEKAMLTSIAGGLIIIGGVAAVNGNFFSRRSPGFPRTKK
ncbi:EamA family transporter [Rossellomorea vietnamensis]|uniref:EamA family transporter n=1 Tax=Rossellomorea vietnamensis TaxID=218284 RepID=A0A5D4KCW7_9BACI|nr:DMT family transporter [Rossellomorea vietnamensis]TYR75174.1 EamA family transporter [Rossellomorea vietnamensis]